MSHPAHPRHIELEDTALELGCHNHFDIFSLLSLIYILIVSFVACYLKRVLALMEMLTDMPPIRVFAVCDSEIQDLQFVARPGILMR